MKLKLVDVLGEPHEVELGTCELCFSTGEVVEPTFVFEKKMKLNLKLLVTGGIGATAQKFI